MVSVGVVVVVGGVVLPSSSSFFFVGLFGYVNARVFPLCLSWYIMYEVVLFGGSC